MPTDTTTTYTRPPVGTEAPPPPDKPIGKARKRGFIWVFFLLIVVGVTAYAVWRASQPGLIPQTNQGKGFGGRGKGAGAGALPVAVAKVRTGPVPIYLNGLGNVTAFYTVTVKSRVDGQIMKFDVQEGDIVKEGQVVAEIDPRPYQVMLQQAEGTLAHDQALLDDAKLDLARYSTLLEQDAIPKQQLDTQKALVAQYEGSIKQDQANINNAKLQLIYSKVTAPITGTVGLRQVDPGNIVHASDAAGIIVITQLQPISVLFTIPEDNLPDVITKLHKGAHLPADAYNRDNSKKLASGMLVTMDNQIDNTTGTSKLKAIFENKNFELFPQQFVNINLLVETLQNQILVPTVAVQNGQQGTFVYVIDQNNVAHIRNVQVLTQDQSGADIKSGLEVGELVAVDGADRLEDGSHVRVRKAGELERQAAADAAALKSRGKGGRGPGGQGKGGQPGGGQPGGGQPGGPGGQGNPSGQGSAEGKGQHGGHGRGGKGAPPQ